MGLVMTIRKVTGLEGGFSIIPNETLCDTLSWEALGLLAYLCSKPDDWDVSIAHLINHSSRCKSPSKRDKTYRILEELEEAGYMRRETKRKAGRFGGTDYLISPTKLVKYPPKVTQAQTELPLTDLPDTDLPDTVKPTQQSKDSNKEREKHIGESVSPISVKHVPIRKKRIKHEYSKEFDAFFKSFPKTNGSKLEAFQAWKKLNFDEKQTVISSVFNYKLHLKKESWQKAMNPARYIKQEHYLSYYAPQGVLKAAERVLVNGKGFDAGTLVQLCEGYFRSSEWKYERLLGPAPDDSSTQIPANIIEKAKQAIHAGQ